MDTTGAIVFSSRLKGDPNQRLSGRAVETKVAGVRFGPFRCVRQRLQRFDAERKEIIRDVVVVNVSVVGGKLGFETPSVGAVQRCLQGHVVVVVIVIVVVARRNGRKRTAVRRALRQQPNVACVGSEQFFTYLSSFPTYKI